MRTTQSTIEKYVNEEPFLAKIKKEIRKWYGIISVKELAFNKDLIAEIEKIERLLNQRVAAL